MAYVANAETDARINPATQLLCNSQLAGRQVASSDALQIKSLLLISAIVNSHSPCAGYKQTLAA